MLVAAANRYFGAGYRAVRYSLHSVRSNPPSGNEAVAHVKYPPHWSDDGHGIANVAHLSSVDAVILSMLATERVASPLERERLGELRVSSIDSGEALTDSDHESFLGLMQALAHQLTTRAPLYRERTTFAFTDAHVSIPAEEWPNVQELARELGRVIHELAERPAGDNAVRASLTVAAFETA
ncbi:AvrD family protein [Rathayibacter sp. AY2B3]|uniref:AvrD family protein n=1 Tax=Rathayibacter sp. AY2B3 TaxID=2080569 RepID=UPI0011B075F0|nr:AvrD family protein [Rathayibacter sp. AY2B3]